MFLYHIFHNPTLYFSAAASGWREIVFTRIIIALLHIFYNPTLYFSVSASGWREIVFTRIILPLLHIFYNPTLYFSVSVSGWREIVFYSLFYTYFTVLFCNSVYQQVGGEISYYTPSFTHISQSHFVFQCISKWVERDRIILPLLHIFYNPTLYFSVSVSGWRDIVLYSFFYTYLTIPLCISVYQ